MHGAQRVAIRTNFPEDQRRFDSSGTAATATCSRPRMPVESRANTRSQYARDWASSIRRVRPFPCGLIALDDEGAHRLSVAVVVRDEAPSPLPRKVSVRQSKAASCVPRETVAEQLDLRLKL